MKKTVSILLILIMLLGAMLSLASCGRADGAPESMQLVRGSDALGYYFYAPEEWTVANHGEMATAFVSKLDTTSVSFVKVEKPDVSIEDYYKGELERFPEGFAVTPVKEGLEECDFGQEGFRPDKAYKAVYSYKYDKYSFRCMQIYVYEGEDFYIFTYTSSEDLRDGENSYYDSHMTSLNKVLTTFKFVDKSGEIKDEAPIYPEVDGYYLISNKNVCYFDFYMPKNYTVDFATSMVSVSHADGSNVNISEATYGGVDDNGYWKHRFEELELIADNVLASGEKFTIEMKGDNTRAVGLEYTYTFEGKDYKVYQALIVVNNWRGFVFTYTAEAGNYDAHLEDAKDMLARLEF